MATVLEDLEAQYQTLSDTISAIYQRIVYGGQQYDINHFGGLSPNEFDAWVSDQTGILNADKTQLNALGLKISDLRAHTPPTPVAPDIPVPLSGTPTPARPLIPIYTPAPATGAAWTGHLTNPYVLLGLGLLALFYFRGALRKSLA